MAIAVGVKETRVEGMKRVREVEGGGGTERWWISS